MEEQPSWVYDAGEPYAQKKHGWGKREPGVRPQDGERVSRCPSNITRDEAEQILREQGRPYEAIVGEEVEGFPTKIYLAHGGVPYEARPTGLAGKVDRYHAYPVLPERFVEYPRAVQKHLEEAVSQQGGDLRRWFKKVRK